MIRRTFLGLVGLVIGGGFLFGKPKRAIRVGDRVQSGVHKCHDAPGDYWVRGRVRSVTPASLFHRDGFNQRLWDDMYPGWRGGQVVEVEDIDSNSPYWRGRMKNPQTIDSSLQGHKFVGITVICPSADLEII